MRRGVSMREQSITLIFAEDSCDMRRLARIDGIHQLRWHGAVKREDYDVWTNLSWQRRNLRESFFTTRGYRLGDEVTRSLKQQDYRHRGHEQGRRPYLHLPL